ncbi:MAG TPA: PKD domain-containing protein [Chitinophagaceae bacterium]|nr:PKD domain-containing protein [Chitinophagaceae bacterium]
MKRLFQILALTLLIAGLPFYSCKKETSCEGCQTDQPTGNTNKAPIALAGTDQTVTLPTDSILLDGSASKDPDGSITVWAWTKISGPSSFIIVNASTVQTQVSYLLQGIYQFELKVTDNAGLLSKDTVQVTVLPPIFNPNNSNVYMAGWGWNASGKMVARIWRENILQDLSDGQYDADALSVFVSGNDIYVAGYERNASGKSVAKLWKNGVSQNLSNGQYDAVARSVFVSGTDVYVAGWEVNASGMSVAKLWKNGVGQALSDGQNNVMANSVYVANSDVYVVGFDGGPWTYYGRPILWKNGMAQNLVGGESSAYSVFVSGSDVYVAGSWYAGEFAKLWKNGEEQNFSSGDQFAEAYSVFVSGSDVYVAGTRYPCAVGGCSDAILWKNGQSQILQLADAGAHSVFVSSNNVYVAGYNGSNAMLWKNGAGYSISGLNTANAVFVH